MLSATNSAIIEELLETWRSIARLCETLAPEQWALPTDLPGWSVRDTAAAARVLDLVLSWLPRAVAKSGVPDGGAAVIQVTGPIPRTAAAAVRGERGEAGDPPASPALLVSAPIAPFLRVACGRWLPA